MMLLLSWIMVGCLYIWEQLFKKKTQTMHAMN
jgi:hypothetical protein